MIQYIIHATQNKIKFDNLKFHETLKTLHMQWKICNQKYITLKPPFLPLMPRN